MNRCGEAKTPFLFAIDYEGENAIFVPQPLQQTKIGFSVNGITNLPDLRYTAAQQPGIRHKAVPYGAYSRKFRIVRDALLRGDSFLANLTVATPVETDVTPEEIFARSLSPYKLWLPGSFISFSPETFIQIDGCRVSTFPMKGTIDAARPDAEQLLRDNPKEQAEHNTIVDLMRNDLSRIAQDVHVSRFRYTDRLKTHRGELLQMSSEISGTLPADWPRQIGDLLLPLLPAGSVSGAPKNSTLRMLARAEGEKRGFYTGVFGYFDGRNLDSAVLIRFIEQHNAQLRFRSGGGITAQSNCREEYRETLDKIYLPF